MKIFVSYSRSDNSHQRLVEISRQLQATGDSVYIDDIHHPAVGDRRDAVLSALDQAEVFVVVKTENYLRTKWTRFEFERAMDAGIALVVLEFGSGVRSETYEGLLEDAKLH
jgi:hypothetical protein